MVARLRSDDEQLHAIIGNLPRLSVGERLVLQGEWTVHRDYGRQFKVYRYETQAPHNEKGIRNFLASGLIKGVGPATAEKIVEHFGLEALDIIAGEPERLCEIPGIGEKRQLSCGSLQERRQIIKVMTFLQSCGVSVGYAARIYRRWRCVYSQ